MLEKSLMVWVALNSGIALADNPHPTQNEVIERLSTHFNEEITEVLTKDFFDVNTLKFSVELFEDVSCRVDQVLESRFKSSDIKTTSYYCEDEFQREDNYNTAEFYGWYKSISEWEACRDLGVFYSSEEGEYVMWEAAFINKLNDKWIYDIDYYYANTNCDELMSEGVPTNFYN